MGKTINLDLKAIREKAEALAAQRNFEFPSENLRDQEVVFQELNIHQIELEIQNEELRAIQQALESSHENYASLFNQAPCGYLILDSSNLIIKANQTFIDMLRLGENNLREKAFVDFLASASRPVFLGQYKAFFNHPEGKRINLEIKRPDGSFLPPRFSATANSRNLRVRKESISTSASRSLISANNAEPKLPWPNPTPNSTCATRSRKSCSSSMGSQCTARYWLYCWVFLPPEAVFLPTWMKTNAW